MPLTTYIEAIRQGIWEEMARDPSVFVLGEDVAVYGGAFKVTEGLAQAFGADRVIDTPLAESAIVGAAVGAAMMGMRPIAEMQFIDFISCAFDQITNVAAKTRYRWGPGVPLVVRGPSGGGVHGGPFHSQNVERYFMTPGLKVVAPATARDAKGLIKSAIRDPDPVIYLEHKFLYRRIKEDLPAPGDGAADSGASFAEEGLVPIGQARIARAGKDLSIITYGAMLYKALEAAEILAREEQAEVEVLDLRTLYPLDAEAIEKTTQRTGKVLIVHEDVRTGGLAGEVIALINERAFEWLDAPVLRVTAPDTPVPFSPPLEDYFLPQVADVLAAARHLLRY